MRRILRFIYRRLLPGWLGPSLDVYSHLRMPDREVGNEKKVLVLSPHPDDDVIGCGGLIRRYVEAGAEVTSVYMTDGGRGSTRHGESELVAIRREEAKRAADIIGIRNLVFLDNPDENLKCSDRTTGQLSRVLDEYEPDAVLVPFFLESVSDHRETSRILVAASRSKPKMMCYAYGVWRPLFEFNCVVDVARFFDLKARAIAAHESQVERADFVAAARGLAAFYDTVTARQHGKGAVEVYIACTAAEYGRLCLAAGV